MTFLVALNMSSKSSGLRAVSDKHSGKANFFPDFRAFLVCAQTLSINQRRPLSSL